MIDPSPLEQAAERWLDTVPVQSQAWLSSEGAGLVRTLLAELQRLRLALEARTQERDDLVCGIPIREKQLTDYTKRVEAAKDAAKAKVQALEGLFCEAHGFNQLQPDVSCPMCEAVHADDDLKRAQQQLADLHAALQGLAAEMRTEYATSGYRRLLHYAERLKEALMRPPEPQKEDNA